MRIVAYKNGDVQKVNGILIAIPDGGDLAGLLEKATQKLGSDTPYTKAYVESGAEVTDIADLVNGDDLFFTTGELLIKTEVKSAASAVEVTTADEKAEEEKKQFIAKIASSVSGVAANLYDTSSNFVKGHSPAFVRVTLEKVEDKVGTIATPLISRVVQVGQWADEKLDAYYQTLQAKQKEFLDSEFATQVNNSLIMPFKQQVIEPSAQFYQASLDNFKQLQKQHGDVTLDSFVTSLRSGLGQAWNEKLVEPAKAFHAAAVAKVAQNQTINSLKDMGAAWHEKVQTNFKSHIQQPAEEFYNAALESYASLDTTGDGSVTLSEFIAGMRVKLGQLWNSKLADPAQHLYNKFHAAKQ